MRLIIVRHAQSIANAKGIQQGQTIDTGLSELGKEQAEQVAERLKDEKIDVIYASDLKRAKETAEAINKYHKKKIILDKRLREKNHGTETWKEMEIRVKELLNELKDENILIVAHGGPIMVLLAMTHKTREEGARFLRYVHQANTCVNVVEKQGKHYKIHLLNCIKHLESDNKIINIFERVQKIPYKVCKFDEKKINENLQEGDCRHKSALLFNLLKKEGYKVKEVKVLFDWKDLPIPKKILSILNKSGTIWFHDIVKVRVHGDYVYVDATWNPELEKKGFPITKNWNSLEDTQQITKGELDFYFPEDEYYKTMYIEKKAEINIDKEEAHEFAEALNNWLSE